MSNNKQLTAMQILYNRNQEIIDKLEFTSNPMQVEYCKALISVNDDIDTDLLAKEREQRKNDILLGYNNAGEIPIDELLQQHL